MVMETLSFKAKHEYSPLTSGIELEVRMSARNGPSIRFLAKIDTGASFSIFQRDYAEQLGIEVESGVPKQVGTATGTFDTFGHTVTLACLDWEFETFVYFAVHPEFNRNVLGRAGWLQRFRLAIVDHESTLYLSEFND